MFILRMLINISMFQVVVKSLHGTVVVWLQNDGGYQRWEPTSDRINALTEAYR